VDFLGGQSVGRELVVVQPVRARKTVAQVVEAELIAGMAAAETLQIGRGALVGGGVDIDEVADGTAVGQSADLGADHVVEGKNGAVGGLSGRSPERLLEDVDLALLTGVRIGDEETAAERISLDVRGPPSARAEACCE